MKNITFINADSILWYADKNIRVVDFRNIFAKIYRLGTPDQIYFIGGIAPTDPFNESIKEILSRNSDKPIFSVPSMTEVSNRHNPEQILTDLLYRATLSQNHPEEIQFTIVSADATTARAANFLTNKKLIKPVNYIVPDDLYCMQELKAKATVADTIALTMGDYNNYSYEPLLIQAIYNIINSGLNRTPEKFLNTTSVLVKKLQKTNGCDSAFVRPFLLSLIHNGYLTRFPFNGENREGEVVPKTAIVFGDKDIRELIG